MSITDEKKEVKTEASEVSKSMQKRIDRAEKQKKAKREDLVGKVIGVIALIVIIGAIAASIISTEIKKAAIITPSDDFSKCLTEEGFVDGVNASKITTLCDYNNIVIPRSEIEMSDEEFEEEKESQLNQHMKYSVDASSPIQNGDKINLDYVGSIDGEEFEGGNSGGNGYDLVIGSGSFIPGFEDQLIGHNVGENFDINVTFPADYSAENLAGRDAVFNCTINGKYEKGKFDDEFVREYLSEESGVVTVKGYREHLDAEARDDKIRAYVVDYLYSNSTLNEFPSKYLKQLKCNQKYSDEQSYVYINEMMAMYGQQGYSSFEEYTGMPAEAYDESLDVQCRQTEKQFLVVQAIAENENIRVTDEEIKQNVEGFFGEGSYEQQLETYKKPYLAQMALNEKVINVLVSKATIQ